jgi:hypothetical protein
MTPHGRIHFERWSDMGISNQEKRRRYEERLRQGKMCVTVEVPLNFVQRLVEEDYLGGWEGGHRGRVGHAVECLLTAMVHHEDWPTLQSAGRFASAASGWPSS